MGSFLQFLALSVPDRLESYFKGLFSLVLVFRMFIRYT